MSIPIREKWLMRTYFCVIHELLTAGSRWLMMVDLIMNEIQGGFAARFQWTHRKEARSKA
jgi:hypothetical protein